MEIKITVFTYLLSDEGFNSFPKHINLALAPNKTNEGVKKQWNTRKHDKPRRIITCLAVLRLLIQIFIGVLAIEGRKRANVRVSATA